MNRLREVWQRHLMIFATAGILVALFAAAAIAYDGFGSVQTGSNLLTDNASLGIAAVGMTLVIFSGGIDLSVGAVIGFTSIFVATLIEKNHLPPACAWAAGLAAGAALGATMGWLIHSFRLPAFLITLAGLFLARGAAFWISTDTSAINQDLYTKLAALYWSVGSWALPVTQIIFIGVLLIGFFLGHHTRFGRHLLAIGSNEQSALLMGIAVGRTKITVYALNGFLAALAGIVSTLYTGSGNPSSGVGLELDAIAIVVMGGTLLSGGRGHLLRTLLGLLVFGSIQSALLFDGRLSPWWGRIVIGALLLSFILLQRQLLKKR